MIQAFQHFSQVSGLQENLEKSSLYLVGVSRSFKDQIISDMLFSKGEMPYQHLGVPLSSKKLVIQQCMPIIEKMITKIKNWTTKLPSYSGRLQLIESVLFEMQTYWAH